MNHPPCPRAAPRITYLLMQQVLASLVGDAEEFTGGQVKKAIISVPAYFDTKQREATIAAGEGSKTGLKGRALITTSTWKVMQLRGLFLCV